MSMTLERYEALMQMPKFKRIDTLNATGEMDDFLALYGQKMKARQADREEQKQRSKYGVKPRQPQDGKNGARLIRPSAGQSGVRLGKNGPTMYGSTQIWDD